ncbi:MAG: amino acid ABC transporter [Deltaproteobacteria bacterium]|nr:MAG: amino acid ABC transporter [Deltaproteobacteria bacterium]RLC17498.1 MAG: amino acid ABC transporter [Deltaproteobacteria bacterium]HHE73848.1 HD domain-containing protein [Desulfobacteraceae bacterium]
MQRAINIYAMYIGHPNGDFFEVVNMDSSAVLYAHFKAPPKTRWTIIKIFDSPQGRVRQFDYLDDALSLILTRSESSEYLANERPWFKQASQSDKVIRTDPYLFSNLQQKGITFAKLINGSQSVLAIDLTLKRLNDYLYEQKFDPSSEVVMFGRDGSIIASSNLQTPDEKISDFLTQALSKGQTDRLLRYNDQGEDTFVMVTALSTEMSADTHLGIAIDADVMLNPYRKKILYSLAIALIFLILTMPLIFYTTSRIIRPIKVLMLQNDKIKARRFDEVTPIKTRISELMDLSVSLVSMTKSIQEYQKAQAELMDAFIKLIADAIDAKSPYTGGHCQRVPKVAMMLAKAANAVDDGPFKDFRFDDDEAWREFEIGAWLHDCGKVTTPEYVVDKATKLETIHNRIHGIRTRFEVIWRDIEIEAYERRLNSEDEKQISAWKQEAQQSLLDDFIFIAECNIGGEFMSQEKQERIKNIAGRTWIRHFNDRLGLSGAERLQYEGIEEIPVPAVEQLLSDRPEHLVKRPNFDEEAYHKQGFKLDIPEFLYNHGEIYNLCIEKGTLTPEERFKINEHVIMSIKMLERLPYPEDMEQIPEYAGTHHETMIGTGYPRQLHKDDLSIPARIMVIADVFEALTASDRPYKKGKTLSQSIKIMGFMKKDEHIDAELFDLFLTSGIYLEYAKRYLKPAQIDVVNIEVYLS